MTPSEELLFRVVLIAMNVGTLLVNGTAAWFLATCDSCLAKFEMVVAIVGVVASVVAVAANVVLLAMSL